MKPLYYKGLVLIGFVFIVLFINWFNHPDLQYEGEKEILGLSSNVDVYTDSFGVPHVFAKNEKDLFFTAGYLAARERLFQLSMVAILVKGEMALNLGFSGFRRGSYDFYKTDWKYLNDATTRGLGGNIDGVLVPAGTSTVYDQSLGKNIKRPFLHVRYRASEADDRKMKSWITGSVGGVYTSDVDEMNVHFLSERCLCVQGANNFVLFKTASQVA